MCIEAVQLHWTVNTTFRGKSELNKFIVLSIIAHTFSSRFNVFISSIDLTKIQRKLSNHKSIRASGMMFLNKLFYYKKRHCLHLKCTLYQRSIPSCRYMLLECHLGAGWKLFLPQVASCQWFGLLPELIHRHTLHVYRAFYSQVYSAKHSRGVEWEERTQFVKYICMRWSGTVTVFNHQSSALRGH